MNISSIQSQILAQSQVDTSDVPLADLAGDKHLTKQQKIDDACRQFAVILLQQILSETQKPVITSEFTDDSTAAGIYQDYIAHSLAESMSKSGAFGIAKLFEEQLTHPAAKTSGHATGSSAAQKRGAIGPSTHLFDKKDIQPLSASRP
jgi:Rod binding domain-containing protein